MKHKVRHDLDHTLAKKATYAALESYRERFSEYNPSVSWTNDRLAKVAFSAKGVSMTGNISLEDGAVGIEMKVPFAFKLFQKKAVEVVESQILKWIDKARAGELDDMELPEKLQ